MLTIETLADSPVRTSEELCIPLTRENKISCMFWKTWSNKIPMPKIKRLFKIIFLCESRVSEKDFVGREKPCPFGETCVRMKRPININSLLHTYFTVSPITHIFMQSGP